ncbi:MAG: class I SAM-dependent methyltransferase [Thermoplasmata archaeon]|nr:class I SAM-dependent methyltransferase [Thermoplasmata archaeon]
MGRPTMLDALWPIREGLSQLSLPAVISGLSGQPTKKVRGYLRELWPPAGTSTAFLYCVTRAMTPQVIVETGVHSGGSSRVILDAVHRNGTGHLYSIDLPFHAPWTTSDGRRDATHLPAGLSTGYLVPEFLRSAWTLIEGDAKVELPSLLARLPNVDVFFHDSEHSFQHQMFEYTAVWPHLRQDGLLISDDTNWSDAFDAFCREKDLHPLKLRTAHSVYGAVRKP